MLRVGLFVAAALLGARAYALAVGSGATVPLALGFCAAALGVLLLATLPLPARFDDPAARPRRGWARPHPSAAAVLAFLLILAGGLVIRFSEYGVMPPSGAICCEEHIAAGIRWEVLQGGIRLAYGLTVTIGALGQLLLGPSTDGLRAAAVVSGVLAMPLVYPMLRPLVSPPAALFGMAVFAAQRVLSDTTLGQQINMLLCILYVLLIAAFARTRSAAVAVGIGALGAGLMYEYETLKALVFVSIPVLALFAVRGLAIAARRSSKSGIAPLRCAGTLLVTRGAVIALAAWIVLVPMIAQASRGEGNVFLSSLNRQVADRSASTGSGSLLAPNATRQLMQAAALMTPWAAPIYPPSLAVTAGGFIDPITSVLMWLGLLLALVRSRTLPRLVVVGWFVAVVVGAALLSSVFNAWKVNGLVPAIAALAAISVDMVIWGARRVSPRLVPPTVGALAVIAGFIFVLNYQGVRANARDPVLAGEFENQPARTYAVCDYLRGQPAGTYALVVLDTASYGFVGRPVLPQEIRTLWGDFKFICSGLEGMTVPDLTEIWPPDVPPGRPVSIVAVARSSDVAQSLRELNRVMPELGKPDVQRALPGGMFQLLAFNRMGAELTQRVGLLERVGDGPIAAVGSYPFTTGESAVGARQVQLSGLVRVPLVRTGAETIAVDSAAPTRVTIDDAVVFESTSAGTQVERLALDPGWHRITIDLQEPSRVPLRMFWVGPDGSRAEVAPDDFYAIETNGLWTHVRQFSDDARQPVLRAIRVDSAPHFGIPHAISLDGRERPSRGLQLSEDRWSAVWTVERSGLYIMRIDAPASAVTLTLDHGSPITANQGLTTDVLLNAGDHTIEIMLRKIGDIPPGGSLLVTDDIGTAITMRVRPGAPN